MPGSPTIPTTCPWPSMACASRSVRVDSSRSRPTNRLSNRSPCKRSGDGRGLRPVTRRVAIPGGPAWGWPSHQPSTRRPTADDIRISPAPACPTSRTGRASTSPSGSSRAVGSLALTSTCTWPPWTAWRSSGPGSPPDPSATKAWSVSAACTARCGNCSSVWGMPNTTSSSEGERWSRTPPNPCTFATSASSQRLAAVPGSSVAVWPCGAFGNVNSMASTATDFCSHTGDSTTASTRVSADPSVSDDGVAGWSIGVVNERSLALWVLVRRSGAAGWGVGPPSSLMPVAWWSSSSPADSGVEGPVPRRGQRPAEALTRSREETAWLHLPRLGKCRRIPPRS